MPSSNGILKRHCSQTNPGERGVLLESVLHVRRGIKLSFLYLKYKKAALSQLKISQWFPSPGNHKQALNQTLYYHLIL